MNKIYGLGLDERIIALEQYVEKLVDDLKLAKHNLKVLEIQQVKQEYEIDVGTIVKNEKGQKFKIVSIDPSLCKPWLVVNPEKKDGTFGKSMRNLYDCWEKV